MHGTGLYVFMIENYQKGFCLYKIVVLVHEVSVCHRYQLLGLHFPSEMLTVVIKSEQENGSSKEQTKWQIEENWSLSTTFGLFPY